MTYRITFLTLIAASGFSCGSLDAQELSGPDQGRVVFAREIQPLLAKHCLVCHGPDKAESGLRLDSDEQSRTTLDSGQRAIVPGDAASSELLRRVTTRDESLRMPPEKDPLSDREIELLRKWVEQGGEYNRHWAYVPITEPALPDVSDEAWIRSPIDRFVLARLEAKGIAPSPEADRPTLIRRLHYDLTGLPPAPSDVDRFVLDESPDAYERIVNQLLDSEHFGERWARHWLDKARYADSDGYEKDNPRMNAWRYRDWVIDAINRDLPFDQFTVEQLAGDLLPDASPMQRLATAFHRQTLTNTEGGTDQEEFRVEATFDRTETTGAVWMGLTLTCARCHTHKYDPISQHEYYQLFAFFNNANEATADVPQSLALQEQYHADKTAYDAELNSITEEYEAAKQRLQPEIDQWVQDMTSRLSTEADPLTFSAVGLVDAKSDSGAPIRLQEDGSLLVSGAVADIDKYTLVFDTPQLPLTGLRLEVLTDSSLRKSGPGRAPNGNFVLSELKAFVGNDPNSAEARRIEFASAEADFSQDKFAPAGVLSSEDRSGWAISPQMGKAHQLTLYTAQPVAFDSGTRLHVMLDQQYGGEHTIGRFRITAMSGFDPLKSLPKQVADAIRAEPASRSAAQNEAIADHVALQYPETAELAKKLAQQKKNAPKSPMMTSRVMAPAQRTTHVLHRGDFLQPSDEVTAGAIAIISETHPLQARRAGQAPDRLDLAGWLVDENHPLTPRVAVNQVWAHLFGRGIVGTVNDFGVRGELPTHPQLLDWLARRFSREMKWSRKELIRTIVMSATYRQSSRHRADLREVDPTNQLLARQNRVRVEAEVVRDLHLAVSGLLSSKIGGPSVFPPLPPGVAELSYANNFKWDTSQDEDRYRRGMYTFFKRTSPYPSLISFDCPDSNTTRLERDSSNTPLQALITLNNDVFAESAQAMARRVLLEGGDHDAERLTYALRLCVARQPDGDEVERFRGLLGTAREFYQSHPEAAEQITQRHAAADVAVPENAAWVATLRMVLNLDEFIVRE